MKHFVACVCGLACCAAALAQPADVAVPAAEPQPVPMSCFAGVLKPSFVSRANANVYDNSAANFYTNTANPRQVIDDLALAPGLGLSSPYPLLVNGIKLAFGVQSLDTTTNVCDFDLEVAFYDSVNTAAAAGTQVADGTPFSVFIIPFRGIAATGGYNTGMVDLSPLAGGGVSMPDNGIFIRVRYLDPGTTTLSTKVTAYYATSMNPAVPLFTVTKGAGSTQSGSWRDTNANGVIEATERANFAFPAATDLYCTLQMAVPNVCPADFNGDQTVDFFDYLDFVDAFSQGCP